MKYEVPIEVIDAIDGYARVTRSMGMLVKLLDAANDNVEIAPGDLAELLAMIHNDMVRQDGLLSKLTA